MRKHVVITFLLLFSVALLAQAPPAPDPAAQAAEIKKLDFLVGEWSGEGWMDMPGGKRETFTSWEKVVKKVNGTALLVEGLHKSKATGEVVHETLAMLTFDPAAKHYSFRTALANGRAGNFTGSVPSENVFVWGMGGQRNQIRYTIKLNDKGEWSEVGEFSPDGENWRKFFEMTLRKVK